MLYVISHITGEIKHMFVRWQCILWCFLFLFFALLAYFQWFYSHFCKIARNYSWWDEWYDKTNRAYMYQGLLLKLYLYKDISGNFFHRLHRDAYHILQYNVEFTPPLVAYLCSITLFNSPFPNGTLQILEVCCFWMFRDTLFLFLSVPLRGACLKNNYLRKQQSNTV